VVSLPPPLQFRQYTAVVLTDPWFLFAVLPGIVAAYCLLHAISPAASAWLLLAASAAVVARNLTDPLALAVIGCHTIACGADIARGRAVVRHPSTLALYLIQFPLLAGGPLVRYTEFSSQLLRRTVGMAAFAYGVRRVVTGLIKLLLIADVLGAAANRIFALPAVKTTPDAAWFGAACFALQVYFRFSGYADIAIGLGRMLGFRYPENFRRPFTADSLREFWRRWNVTLITWLRDYLSLPIAGQDRPTPRLYLNIVLGFCLVALWHRPGWSALVCGVFFGSLLAIEGIGFHERLQAWPRPLRHVYVLVVVTFGWMLLRADSPAAALSYAGVMVGASGAAGPTIGVFLTPMMWLALTLAFIGAGPLVPSISRWRVSVDAGTTSLLMMLAATGLFVWRPAAVVIQVIRNWDTGIKNSNS
jgi:alginate O-acetyltransferase complex protein AlgI